MAVVSHSAVSSQPLSPADKRRKWDIQNVGSLDWITRSHGNCDIIGEHMKPIDRIHNLLSIASPMWIRSSAIIEICGLWSGTAYVALAKLEKIGLIESCWEDEKAPPPRHRQYRLKPVD